MYNLRTVRKLILEACDSDTLKRMFMYHARLGPIVYKFGPGMSFEMMVDEVIHYCDQYMLFDDLLQAIVEENPNRYRLFEPLLFLGKINNATLQDVLFNLDRDDHRNTFKQKLKWVRNGAAAFLIHGQSDCGQDVLVQHLIRLATEGRVREHQTIYIDLGRKGVQINMPRLWREVSRSITGLGHLEREETIDSLMRSLKTKDVTIVLDHIDRLPLNFFAAILEEFWQLMVAKKERTFQHEPQGRLLLMLVDWSGLAEKWAAYLDTSQVGINPLCPFKLPESEPFKSEDIAVWLDDIAPLLPIPITLETLLGQTANGLPSLIYDWLCDLCDYSLENVFTRGVSI